MFKNKKIIELTEKVESYRIERDTLRNKVKSLEHTCEDKNKELAELHNMLNRLINSNTNLCDWIEKIMIDVGCYEISPNNSIRIPMYKNITNFGFDKGDSYIQTETVLPEIKIYKRGKMIHKEKGE